MSTEHLDSQYAYWTRTGMGICFPYTSIPAYAVLPLLPCLFYLRLTSIVLAMITVLLIWIMSRKGYTLTWLMYRIRGRMAGNRYSSRPVTYIRRFSLRNWYDSPY